MRNVTQNQCFIELSLTIHITIGGLSGGWEWGNPMMLYFHFTLIIKKIFETIPAWMNFVLTGNKAVKSLRNAANCF